MKKIYIILGSTRQNRFGETVAKWVLEEAKKQSAWATELLDLREVNLPFFNEPQPPTLLNGHYSTPEAQRWSETIRGADGIFFVTPEYNHSYPGVLKNAIDYLFDEWQGKPYMIISYSPGAIGGARAGEQLRALLNYIGLQQRGEMNITFATKQFDDAGKLLDPKWSERLQKLFASLTE